VSNGQEASGASVTFDPKPALSIVGKLPFCDAGGRYLLDSDGNALCAWIDEMGFRPKMRFAQIRRVGLPQVETAGNLSDLALQASEGLVEVVHVVFFPDGIAGVEFNFYGPRPSRLGYYLGKLSNSKQLPEFQPLLRLDVAAQLDRLTDVRLLDLKVRPSYSAALKMADVDLSSAFSAAAKLGTLEEIELVIRPTKGGAKDLVGRIRNFARHLLGRADLRTEASRFSIRGKMADSGLVEPLDLLRDQLISNKRIIRVSERSRALNSPAAYAAVSDAYDELADDLKQAATLVT
jgi:hypothetical protein